MLINCPKCGFSQPQDQFCAQCGVDIQSYKPKEKPLLQQIIGNTFFQISILVLVAYIVGQMILKRSSTTKLTQRNFKSQGISKSVGTERQEQNEYQRASEEGFETLDPSSPPSVNELSSSGNRTANARSNSNSGTNADSLKTNGLGSEANSQTENQFQFKLIYAEAPIALVNQWITESSNLGYYQSLPEYSVGALDSTQIKNSSLIELKTADLKIAVGSSNTNLAGTVSDDGTQIMGLATTLELKALENNSLIGHVNVTKGSRLGTENYPADFELPKGTAFFIIGALKIENFQTERAQLQMPPFQIYKSNNFMTRKTEFVIIVVPDYK